MESSINLLRGKSHEAMDNRGLASECFREALRGDVYCFEAFESLVNHHMLTAQEGNKFKPVMLFREPILQYKNVACVPSMVKSGILFQNKKAIFNVKLHFYFIFCFTERELLDSLPFTKQCPNEEEVTLLKFLYENRLKKVRWTQNHCAHCNSLFIYLILTRLTCMYVL